MKKENGKLVQPQPLNQIQKILCHLKKGQSINAMEARTQYNIFRLSARIWEIKTSGYSIISTLELMPNGKYAARYSLEENL